MELDNVDYLVSKTTKEAAVLLFTAYQLLEIDPEADFNIEVYKKFKYSLIKQKCHQMISAVFLDISRREIKQSTAGMNEHPGPLLRSVLN